MSEEQSKVNPVSLSIEDVASAVNIIDMFVSTTGVKGSWEQVATIKAVRDRLNDAVKAYIEANPHLIKKDDEEAASEGEG